MNSDHTIHVIRSADSDRQSRRESSADRWPWNVLPAARVRRLAWVTCVMLVVAQVDSVCAGVVVSANRDASEVGRDVLRDGGNAVDAAVAVAVALAVTWPEAGNIGGGGFMMIHPADGRPPVCIDYREKAPLAATRTMFGRKDSYFSRKVVGVPGTVRGLGVAHRQFGRLPWKRLVTPAVQLARSGFGLDQHQVASINRILKLHDVQTDPLYAELRRVYGKPGGGPWRVGDRMALSDLADTLQAIADGGPDAFYRGPVADKLVAEMRLGQGIIRQADLNRYQAKTREPIRATFRGHQVFGPPPPSSGGTCLVLMLNMLETFDLKSHPRDSVRNLHLMTEVMRRAYLERARHLGDTDFVDVPARLTSKEFARSLAATIDPERATPSASLEGAIPIADESPDTTHFSIVDQDGMAVSNTYTLEASWGSRIVVKGAGFLLNNEMGDFNWLPGVTERGGRIGTPANQISPEKRMLSSQTPVIVARDGKVVLVTGSPGGRTIINTSLCMVLNVLEFGMDLDRAVRYPRMHHQWLPDRLILEDETGERFSGQADQLRRMGHEVRRSREQGSAHSIHVIDGKPHGVADHRRGGFAATLLP